MQISTLFFYTVALLLIAFFRLRAERSRLKVVDGFLTYPGSILILLHAFLATQWIALGIALAATTVLVGGWWFTYGKNLPTPTSDNIKVWGQEQKKPSQIAAEALEEVERLKKEKEELEKEIKELKEKQGS